MEVGQKTKDLGFVDNLREIQGEYIVLTELYEKEKSYGQKLSEMMRALQYEVDATIQIRPEALGEPLRAAYLVSEAVVVSFDMNGGMSSRPLYRFPPSMIISIIEECTPELRRLISAKRLEESNKVRSLERVLKELKKAQATLKQSPRDEFDLTEEDSSKEAALSEEDEAESEPEEEKVTQQGGPQPHAPKDSFAFKGSFGGKREIPGLSS
jgi:hypothetical protein